MDIQELAVAVQKKMFDQDWFSQWLGIQCLEMKLGYCKLSMLVRKEMLNGFQIIHGGVTFSLADSALAFAANSHGRVSVSIEASMSYLQSAKEGDTLVAEAVQISISDKIAVYHISVTNQNGMTISDFKGTVYRTPKEHFTPSANA
jgi:acyl-CoA thioesterase